VNSNPKPAWQYYDKAYKAFLEIDSTNFSIHLKNGIKLGKDIEYRLLFQFQKDIKARIVSWFIQNEINKADAGIRLLKSHIVSTRARSIINNLKELVDEYRKCQNIEEISKFDKKKLDEFEPNLMILGAEVGLMFNNDSMSRDEPSKQLDLESYISSIRVDFRRKADMIEGINWFVK